MPLAYGLALLGLLAGLLIHLGTSPAGLSPDEFSSRGASASLGAIAKNPVNAPHKLVMLLFNSLGFHGNFSLRLSSVVFGVAFAVSFYFIARSWFGKTVGFFGAVLFISTPLILISARQASSYILLLAPVSMMALYNWLMKTADNKTAAWFALLAFSAAALYVPGMAWLLAGGALICFRHLKAVADGLGKRELALGFIAPVLILIPLIVASARDPSVTRALVLFPAHWPPLISFLKNIGWMVLAIFAKSPYHDNLIVGQEPLLDVIQSALLLLGIYAMLSAARRKALAMLAGVGVVILLSAVNDNLKILLLGLPAIGLLAAAGFRYLYIEWRGVFPRNPIPKSLAIALMSVLVVIHVIYGLSYSLAAWPHTLATHSLYMLK